MAYKSKFFSGFKNFAKKLKQGVVDGFNKRVKKQKPRIIISLKNEIRGALMDSPTYASLIGGDLRGEIGFPKGTERQHVDTIVETIVEAIDLDLKQFQVRGNKINGQLIITLVPDNFRQIYQKRQAYIFTEKGQSLPWIRWLLEEGSRPLVIGYDTTLLREAGPGKAAAISKYSRSGIALMFKVNGGGWMVPPLHQGTPRNNWITRALEKQESRLERAIQRGLEQ